MGSTNPWVHAHQYQAAHIPENQVIHVERYDTIQSENIAQSTQNSEDHPPEMLATIKRGFENMIHTAPFRLQKSDNGAQ